MPGTYSIQGIDLSTSGSIAYAEQADGPNLNLLLNESVTDNANYVEIGGLGTIDLTTGAVDASQTVPLTDIASAAAAAEADGLSVMFDPILVSTGEGSYATSLENPNATFVASAFFAGYQAYIVQCAETAQAAGVKIFSIGSEMRAVTGSQYTSYWDQIIAAVRQVYSGELTYKAVFEPGYPAGTEAAQIGFWSTLDFVSLDVYPVLGTEANPTIGELGAAWTSAIEDGQPVDYAQAIAAIAAATGKSILIAETGVASMNGGEAGPANDYLISQSSTQSNFALQANWWRAFFNTFGADPPSWLSGVFAFGMDPDVDGDDRTSAFYLNSYSLYGKPAETVIADWFGGKGDLANSSNDFLNLNRSQFLIESSSGQVVVGALVSGQIAYTGVAALGSEWTFHGTGDFLGDGNDDFLIENTAGYVYLGEVNGGSTSYTGIAAIGPEWSFEGNGDFLGTGDSEFLIQNTSGMIDLGKVVGGVAQFTTVGSLTSDWTFVGTGDYLGDGKAQFLIEDTAGYVYVGEVNGSGTSTAYTGLSALGPEWKFVESGDFMGDGKTDYLIENTAGYVYIGEYNGSSVTYTNAGALGSEWTFVGAGDYSGTGKDSFLIEDTAGDVYTGTMVSGSVQFAKVTALGSQWKFHD